MSGVGTAKHENNPAFVDIFTRKCVHMLLIYKGLSLTGPLRTLRSASAIFILISDGKPSCGFYMNYHTGAAPANDEKVPTEPPMLRPSNHLSVWIY